MMRRSPLTHLYVLFCALLLSLSMLAGCDGPADEGGLRVGVSAQALSANDVTKITVTVSGAGISPDIVQDLVKTNGQWGGIIGGVPAGPNLTVQADAFDAGNTLIYTGLVTGVTVSAGGTAAVVIVLHDSTPPDPFTNSAPRITGLFASASQVEPGHPVDLTLTAVDADGDPLTYAWSAPQGSFAGGGTATPTWTAPLTEGDDPLSVSVTDGNGGQAGISLTIAVYSLDGGIGVTVEFNTWPAVTLVTATPGQVDVGQTSVLDVTAVDGDGDPLLYAWSDSGCGGSFDDATAQSPIWTAPGSVPPGGTCALVVTVSDIHGGLTTGTLNVNVGLPAVPNAAPVIDQTFQSASSVAPAGTVQLQVTAHDPEGGAVTFAWGALEGSLGAPVNGATSSQVTWTAPAGGGPFLVSATVTDAQGAVTTRLFVVTLFGVHVVAGDSHSLLLKADGTLWAAGWNLFGQLGDGTTTDRHGFVQVLTDVASVSAGPVHTMAVKRDGTLWATGFNDYGELGDGTTTSSLVFVQVMSGVVVAVAGDAHSLALRADGTLWGTGYNGEGELGDGTTTDRHGFVQVLSGVANVSSRWDHTLALKPDGTLWATGRNSDGQLGDGTKNGSLVYLQVLSNVASCSAGYGHSLAIKSDGTLWSTGLNDDGELGNGTVTGTSVFASVSTGVRSLSAGGAHTMAVKTSGDLFGAGRNADGELGDGTQNGSPSFLQLSTGVSIASTGYAHTLMVKTDDTLWVTGSNFYGQLGDGTTTNRAAFVQVAVP